MSFFEIRGPVLWLAGLGFGSGLVSAYPPEAAEKLSILEVPVHPGLVFGFVIGFGVYRWGRAGWTGAVLSLVFTIAAWIAAVRGFYLITDDASTNMYLGGLLAGAIGAAGTILGGTITIRALRNTRSWVLTVFIGAVAGLTVVPEARALNESFVYLFVIWQTCVAACIGYALSRHGSSG